MATTAQWSFDSSTVRVSSRIFLEKHAGPTRVQARIPSQA